MLRRLRAIGASSSQTSKTRSNSARSKSLSDRMSLPEKASHRRSFLRFGWDRCEAREEERDAFVVVDVAELA